MMLYKKGKRQEGQTLLIVVLIMVISLTVGLSIASKTITNLRTTTEEASSAQALSAAETGVAQSIKSGLPAGSGFTSNNTTFSSSVTSVGGTTSFLVNGGNVIPQDEGADVWLIAHDSITGALIFTPPWAPAPAVGTLTIYWGDSPGDCNNPSKVPAALEIVTITGTQASPVSKRSAYDPCTRSNNFTSVSPSSGNTVSGKTFYYSTGATISVTNGLLVRIIPLYANTVLAVSGGLTLLPQQGSIITSTGQSSNVVRKISVVANYYSLPSEFFTYGLFVPR